MKYYKVNYETSDSVQTNLSNMEPVLQEIAVTYRILIKLLSRYEQAADIPALNEFRTQLQAQVTAAMTNAEIIAGEVNQFSKVLADINKEIAKL
ncbi:hypothetical protein H7Y63_00495 [Polaromonas sp.]|nr:hypothetical protein [Candidatus Saccharibacteria bacterium]